MDDLIVTFFEDRRSWLILIAGTLGLALLFVLPGVDEYIAVCSEKTSLTDKLADAGIAAGKVPQLEKRWSEKRDEVEQTRLKTLNAENLTEYRKSMVQLVRETGCQLRRLQLSSGQSRIWGEKDRLLEKQLGKKMKPSGFQLEKRVVTLSLAGSSANVRQLLKKFEEQRELVHVQEVELRPGREDGRRVELSLELWYFNLSRTAA